MRDKESNNSQKWVKNPLLAIIRFWGMSRGSWQKQLRADSGTYWWLFHLFDFVVEASVFFRFVEVCSY